MEIKRSQVTTERYHLTITQSALHVAIDVRPGGSDSIMGGYITALKQLHVESLQPLRAEVVFNVSFAKRRPEAVKQVCDWMTVTADLAKQLDYLFSEREDFGRIVTVEEKGRQLLVYEAEIESTC